MCGALASYGYVSCVIPISWHTLYLPLHFHLVVDWEAFLPAATYRSYSFASSTVDNASMCGNAYILCGLPTHGMSLPVTIFQFAKWDSNAYHTINCMITVVMGRSPCCTSHMLVPWSMYELGCILQMLYWAHKVGTLRTLLLATTTQLWSMQTYLAY